LPACAYCAGRVRLKHDETVKTCKKSPTDDDLRPKHSEKKEKAGTYIS